MVPSSLLFWSTLSSSRKVSLRVICPEYLGPATWLSKHSSALQGVLKATGQTGTEGTFATFAAITSSFLSLAKVPIVQGYKKGTGFALAVPALLLYTPAGGQWGQGLCGTLLDQGVCKNCTTWKIQCLPCKSVEL